MSELLSLLIEIKKKPELYIGCKDIMFLRHYLSGYCMAKAELITGYGDWLFNDFRIFLAEKYQDNRSYDWSGLIIENEEEGNSTDTFFGCYTISFQHTRYKHYLEKWA